MSIGAVALLSECVHLLKLALAHEDQISSCGMPEGTREIIDRAEALLTRDNDGLEFDLLKRELAKAKAESRRLCELISDDSKAKRAHLDKKWQQTAKYRDTLQFRADELGI